MVGECNTIGGVRRKCKSVTGVRANHLGVTRRGVDNTLLAVLASLGILAKTGIARHLWRRWRRRRRRGIGRLAGVYAGSSLALGDEVSGAFVGDDLEVVRATGVCDVDRRRRPNKEDDGPLLLSHGDVLGVVVPVIAEVVELALKFMGDGEYGGVVGGWEVYAGTEECASFGVEKIEDFAPDKGSDGRCVGHGVVIMQGAKCL